MKNMKALLIASALFTSSLQAALYNNSENRERKPLPPLTSLYIQDDEINQNIVWYSKQTLVYSTRKKANKYIEQKKKLEENYPKYTITSSEMLSIQKQTIAYVLCRYMTTEELTRITENTELGGYSPSYTDFRTLIHYCNHKVPYIKNLGLCIETLNKNIARERHNKVK